MKANCRLIFSLLILSVLPFQNISAQEPAQSDETILINDRVVDVLFAYPRPDFRALEYWMMLRFLPSWDAESQIIISGRLDGVLEVESYSLEDKGQTISQITDVEYLRGVDDPRAIAQKIRVQKKSIATPPQALKDLLANFSDLRLSPDLDRRVTLDGTQYELRFETASNVLYYRLIDAHEGYDGNAYPLVRWMNQAKRAVLAQAERQ